MSKFCNLERQMTRVAYDRGWENAMTKEVENAARRIIRQHPELLGPQYVEMLEYIGKGKLQNEKPYVFVTINPYPDADRLWFETDVQAVIRKKWVADRYSYSFEEDKKGRYHVHLILYRGKKVKSEIIREIYNTCKTHLGDPSCVDVETIKRNNKDVYKYIHKSTIGEKHESEIFFNDYFIQDDSSSEEQEGDT